jgi:hypothetical protein
MARMTKKKAAMLLADAPEDKRFWCSDGRVLKNLSELQSALNDMTAETFRHHSSEGRNDFANWVRDVISDEKLSNDLRKSSTPIQAAKWVASRIAWLRSKMAVE